MVFPVAAYSSKNSIQCTSMYIYCMCVYVCATVPPVQESKHSVTVLKLNTCVQAVAVGYSSGDTFVILFGSVRDAESSVKRYVIREPDHVPASALVWEEGGEKLMIGYTNGKLVQVEMQFEKVCTYVHACVCACVCVLYITGWV